MSFIDGLILIYGVYVIYQACLMKRSGRVPEGIFIAKGVSFREQADTQGYIDYIGKKAIVLGILGCICGLLGLVAEWRPEYDWIGIGGYLVFLFWLILFMVASSKGRREFLDPK